MKTNTIARLLILCIAGVSVFQLSAGQSPKGPSQPRKNDLLSQKDHDEQQNALQTLLYLRNSVSEIESPEDRVRVLLEIGDALWLIDKEGAREVFRQSFTRATEFDTSATTSKELQQLVMTRVAKRDPALAKSLSITVSEKAPQQPDAFAELYGVDGSRSEMLVKAAADTLSSDTSQAVQTAKLAVPGGLSQQMRLFLLTLRTRDRVASDSLFVMSLQAASNRRPKNLIEALFLWDYAFQRPTIYLGSIAWFREAPIEYEISLDLKRRALSFAVGAVIENAQQFYLASASEAERPVVLERYALLHSLAAQILPDVERFIPSATPSLLAQLNRLNQELRDQGRKLPGPPEPLPKSSDIQGSVDKLLERATQASNVQVRDGLYAKAAFRLYLHADYERAIDVARNIEDASLRLKVTEAARFDWAGDLISRRELDTASSIAQNIETSELRVVILVRLATACFENKKATQGIAAVNEAEAAANKANPSRYLASAMLGIGQVYLKIDDRNQATALTSAAIRMINATEASNNWDSLSSTKEGSKRFSVQDTQWTSRRDGGLSSLTVVYPQVTGLLDALSNISETSLDEGLMLARLLKPKALNYAAQAALCRQAIERVQRSNRPAKTSSARERF